MQQGLNLIVVGLCVQYIPLVILGMNQDYISLNLSLSISISVLLTLLLGYYLLIRGCRRYCRGKGYSSRWGWLGLLNVFILPFFILLNNKNDNPSTTKDLEIDKFNKINYLEIILALLSIGLSMAYIFSSTAYLAVDKQDYNDLIKNLTFANFMILIVVFCFLFFLIRYIDNANLNWKYITGLDNSINYQIILTLAFFSYLFLRGFIRLLFYYLSLIFPDYVENYLNDNLYDNVSSQILYALASFILIFILEIIFNTIVLHKISIKKGIITGLLISSLICSLLWVTNFAAHFVMRVIVGILYLKTKNLMTPIVFSCLITLFDYIYNFFFNLKSDPTDFISISEYHKIAEASLGYRFLMLAISLPYLIYFIYKNWPTQNQMLPYFANQQKELNSFNN
ncbi:type II CAAX prenyl endopeptidase Rce1 family protein [Chroococcus sp. FPU101]|uniref:CPBP family glutamic-type intramembrane protease n=1 Tax=Chroococcus sp. FPU101 TaxID=1974212 RepID=UPI001A8F3C11|nr:CPBP family glutamic-type intramembrane protease [Chroococcus sp. FPU101]GFE70962.1 hypothetical protein CFPU101_35720 [Chroococcus sp. FPU101]